MQNEYIVNDIMQNDNNIKGSTTKKIIITIGVILVLILIILLMYHFFVKKSYITCNYSTDKKIEYITLNGKQEVMTTQKYIGCTPDYTIRYDVDSFDVFKYKDEDIFKYKNNEGVAILIRETEYPTKCDTSIDIDSITCHITEGDDKDIYYMSKDNKNYQIIVKTPEYSELASSVNSRINYMLKTFAANTQTGKN